MPDGSSDKVRRGRKFDQVIEGAREVFLSDGFEGASVDDIARRAGVSKATLYSYFPDKRLLFMEVASLECRRQADAAMETIDVRAPVRQVLTEIARQMIAFISSDLGQRIFRICVGEGDRFPNLGREFFKTGPALARERIIAFLEMAAARGEVQIDDYDLAAVQFIGLVKADLHDRLVFNLDQTITTANRDRVITGAVDMFMARYGTPPR